MKKICVVVLSVASLVCVIEFTGRVLPRQTSIVADGSDPMPFCRPQPNKPACPQDLTAK
jgi:hypothetical protein